MELGFLETLHAYSTLIQALATVVMAGLTIYYVSQAHRSATELEQSRKSEFIPILTINAEATDDNGLDVSLGNIGKGLAQNPYVFVPFEKEPQKAGSIRPGEEGTIISFTHLGIAEIFEIPQEERMLRVEYQDIFGRTVVSEAMLMPGKNADGEDDTSRLCVERWAVRIPKED